MPDPLGLKLEMVVSCHMGASNQTTEQFRQPLVLLVFLALPLAFPAFLSFPLLPLSFLHLSPLFFLSPLSFSLSHPLPSLAIPFLFPSHSLITYSVGWP